MRSKLNQRACLVAVTALLLAAFALPPVTGLAAQSDSGDAQAANELPPALIQTDEGGPERISGKGNYTSLTLPPQYQRPAIALVDRGGYYVGRDNAFVATPNAQVLARIAGDFARPPFAYTIELPAHPHGTLWDLGEPEAEAGQGVQVYEVMLFADLSSQPGAGVLDPVEQANGGALASVQTTLPVSADAVAEPYGGTLMVFSTAEGQAFPSGWGDDGRLFTDDDPLVALPAGWTAVTLGDEFVFSRGREETVPLYEPGSLANVSLGEQDLEAAFNGLVDLLQERYAYTELRKIDWEAWRAELLPAVQVAAAENDLLAFYRVVREMVVRMKDVHMRLTPPYLLEPAYDATSHSVPVGLEAEPVLRDGLLILRDRTALTTEGRLTVLGVAAGSAAEEAGILPGAEILAVNGMPVTAYLEQVAEESGEGTLASNVTEALQFRLQPGTQMELLFRNPDADEQAVTLAALAEGGVAVSVPAASDAPPAALRKGSGLVSGPGATEAQPQGVAAASPAPAPYAEVVGKQVTGPAGTAYGYLAFTDMLNVELKATLFQHYIEQFTAAGLPGLVIDLRQNSIGSTQLMEQLVSYFFTANEPFRAADYVERVYDPVAAGWATIGPLGISPQLPIYAPAPHLAYPGRVVILVGRRCQGACEFFASWMQRAGRATVLGAEGTVGAGGAIAYVDLPGGGRLQYTFSAELLQNGTPYIEGIGVQPDVRIPLDDAYVQELAAGRDPDLDFAVRHLDSEIATVQYKGPGDATASPQQQAYTCAGNVALSVTQSPTLALVVFDGRVRTLTRQETTSGQLYADQAWEWRSGGTRGSLTRVDTRALLAENCVPAP